MLRKKILALLLAAAMALSLLAGCGGGESAASALLKLLDGKYPNISVEIDPDLEADLRQAIRTAEAQNAGDDAAVIRAALETALGSNITFRYLGDGQQGDTAFDLIFYAGSDPDKAAQAAYNQWNLVFSNVPADGQYGTSLAMVETNSGVWMLVKATVEKAGTVDKPDSEPEEPEEPFTPTENSGTITAVTINTPDGLEKLLEELKASGASGASSLSETLGQMDITLKSSVDLPVDWPEDITFTGTLNGNGKTITMKKARAQGLFNTIDTNGKVLNVDIEVSGTISKSSSIIGAVAGTNNGGTISGCNVTISGGISSGDISSGGSNEGAGGVVGINNGGTISGCKVNLGQTTISGAYAAGGVASQNENGGIVEGCSVEGGTIEITQSLAVKGSGGVVGRNSGTVTACYHANGTVSGKGAGGVVGWNLGAGTVTACYHANGTISGPFSSSPTGGVVGSNDNGTINDCYWSGNVDSNKGIGYPDSYTPANAAQVTDGWTEDIIKAMNDAIANWNVDPGNDGKLCDYQYQDGNPPKIIPGAPSPATPVTP